MTRPALHRSALTAGTACILSLAGARASALPPGLVDQTYIGGWSQAVGVTFADDGRGYVWEKAGLVWIIENGQRHPTPLIDIRDEVRNYGDHGLLGFALDPDFLTNGRIYLLYAVDYYHLIKFGQPDYDPQQSMVERDSIGRITRYTCNPQDGFHSVIPGSRTVLVGESITSGFPHVYNSHGIGTLAFGADGSLLAGSGDGASWAEADNGGPRNGSSNTGLADGVITPKEDVGAFRSQLIDSLAGKIIRINPETGDGMPDNPYYDPASPRAAKSRVWALGFRNPYRFSVKPGSATPANPAGVLYVGDVGYYSREEFNIVTSPGQNFGWPLFEGTAFAPEYPLISPYNQDAPNPLFGEPGCDNPFIKYLHLIVQDTLEVPRWPNPCDTTQDLPPSLQRFMHVRPIIEFGHGHPVKVPIFNGPYAATIDVTDPNSPVHSDFFWGDCAVGGVWNTGSALGVEYQDTYFTADFAGGLILNFVFDEDGHLHEVRPISAEVGAIVCLAMNPVDQSLYYISYGYAGGASLHRIASTGNLPPTVEAQMSVQYGDSPLIVRFFSQGTFDPEGGELQYEWDFGDGSPTSDQPSPFHTFTAPTSGPARFDVTLTVTDNGNHRVSTSLFVSPNNSPPTVAITSPIDGLGLVVNAPQSIPLSATRDDAETPGSLTCTWQAILHHNLHTHPEAELDLCTANKLISAHGAVGDIAYYELQITVTDPQGLSTMAAASVFPLRCDTSAQPLQPIWTCPYTVSHFTAVPEGSGPFVYQWQRELIADSGLFVPIADGPTSEWGGTAFIEGTSTATITLIPDPGFSAADSVRYRCIASGPCGSISTAPARLYVCSSDFDCSGFVDTDDFDAFVRAFEAGDQAADADASGFVDTDDFDYFVRAFEAGC